MIRKTNNNVYEVKVNEENNVVKFVSNDPFNTIIMNLDDYYCGKFVKESMLRAIDILTYPETRLNEFAQSRFVTNVNKKGHALYFIGPSAMNTVREYEVRTGIHIKQLRSLLKQYKKEAKNLGILKSSKFSDESSTTLEQTMEMLGYELNKSKYYNGVCINKCWKQILDLIV